MDRWWLPRRRPEPAAIDITWVSCRGVRSSVPFHTPCLYASIYLHQPPPPSSSAGKGSSSSPCGRRPHRVKTATDRTGGGNPEWDAPLRLYLPVSDSSAASSSSPASSSSSGEREAAAASPSGDKEDCLLLRFELKSEVAVLGDVLSATAAVLIAELVADGRTRRVSYQLVGPDGKHPNGVISFSYAFHADRSSPNSDADDDQSTTSSSECESITPPCSAASRAIALPPSRSPPQSATGSSTMYPVIDWPPTEQVIPMLLYPPAKPDTTAAVTGSTCYTPPPPTIPMEPVAVFPPPSPACGMYPPTMREPVNSGMYPRVDLDPVSCYPPPTAATIYSGGCRYAAAPEWDGRWLRS